ncbi:MAG: BatA domain-containing protein [Flavobacteriales bacterium]|nr:BatA domain-containing protein [Flavobacteriales bacterium]
MQFVYPQFLWALLALIIPIVIHLFNFKRYKTLYFSSLSFIKQVDQKTKSTKSIKHYLILASRLMAFIFLILAFAQPFFPSQESENQTLDSLFSIYIDNSFSMESKGTEGELLSQARENAREIINEANLDTRFIVVSNDLSGSEKRILTKIEALEKIDEINFSPLSRKLEDVVEWQTSVFNKNMLNQEANIQSILISDFQHLGSNSSNQLPIQQTSFYPIKLNPETNNNVYIDSLWFSSPIHKIGVNKELNIRIKNSGQKDISNSEILINIDRFNRTIFVDIPANSEIISQISYQDKSIGKKKGVVQVIDNNLFFDNNYYVSYDVKSEVEILVINGEDAIPNVEMVLDLDDYFSYTSKEITSITKNDFNAKDFVIINGLNTLTNGISNFLSDFSEAGGSIMLFPGRTPNKFNWNRLLQILKLPTMGQKVSSGTKINQINYDDPFFKGVFEKNTQKLNLPSVSIAYNSLVSNQSMASSLILLQNGLSLLSVTKKKGNAYMFYSSLHSDYGSFSKDALFSTILLRSSELSQRKQPEFMIIGDDTKFPIYENIDENNPIHIKNDDINFIPRSSSTSGVHYISLKNQDVLEQLKAGNYWLETDRKIGVVSLNYNRTESQPNKTTEQEIKSKLTQLGAKKIQFNEVGGKSNVTTIEIDKPFSYWKFCIVLTLIFVFTEMLLIRFIK